MTTSRTYTTLKVSQSTYEEIRSKIQKSDCFLHDGVIDLHGFAIQKQELTSERVAMIKLLEISKFNGDFAETHEEVKRWRDLTRRIFDLAGKPTLVDIDEAKSSGLWEQDNPCYKK